MGLKILQKKDYRYLKKDYINSIELVKIPIKRQYQKFHHLNEEEKQKLCSRHMFQCS